MRKVSGRAVVSCVLCFGALYTAAQQSASDEEQLGALAYFRQQYSVALPHFEAAARAGNKEAYSYLGYMYEAGRGVQVDLNQAAVWFQKSVAAGNIADKANLDGLLRNLGAQPQAPETTVTQYQPAQQVQTAQGQADDSESERQNIANKIEQLQSDKEEQESEAENWDQEAEQLGDTSNCTGPSAGICRSMAQIAVNKAEGNAKKARRAAQEDQDQIDELQGESNNLAQQEPNASPPAPQQPGYDPNALVNLGNQQAAQMRALGACNACARNADVAQYKSDCSKGIMSACYRAAAALCQCQLNSGGCGSDTQQLQQCVDSNTSTADAMKGGYINVTGGNTSSNGKTNPPSGQNQKGCWDGKSGVVPGSASWSACGGW